MSRTRTATAVLVLLSVLVAAPFACAAEVTAGETYCFSQTDFAQTDDAPLTGICITQTPDASLGTVTLGPRTLRAGDILTAEQVGQMLFSPARTQEDATATLSFLPIYENRVAPSATVTLAIRGTRDKAPVAEDSALETYKNLALRAKLKASDPEGEMLTYTVIREPKRGTVTIHDDGSFEYMPKKNKVGIDSFVFTATDPAGNVSREATVTITILKPSDATLYTDTSGCTCQFSAEWMKNTGIFVAETVAGESCFQPEKTVTRGEFITMLVKTLDVPVDAEITESGYADDLPAWLKPYLAAAVRAGLTSGLMHAETFGAAEPITGAEVAVMLQNALDLPATTDAVMAQEEGSFGEQAIAVLAENGFSIESEQILTREDVAETLYLASKYAERAAGALVLRES